MGAHETTLTPGRPLPTPRRGAAQHAGRRQASAGTRDPLAFVLRAQGSYFLATGMWPLLHYRSFERVTGPKQDDWLVKTVGLLIAAIGGALLLDAPRPRRATTGLAAASAGSLAAVDLVYSLKGRISPVYLLDAVLEVALVGCLAAFARPRRRDLVTTGL